MKNEAWVESAVSQDRNGPELSYSEVEKALSELRNARSQGIEIYPQNCSRLWVPKENMNCLKDVIL